uniref:Col_cuticle_N domain-containing protein n=1 Tax=Meloidogyne hapla TaxID=6305 RepID=A0A1I8BL92_MELHA
MNSTMDDVNLYLAKRWCPNVFQSEMESFNDELFESEEAEVIVISSTLIFVITIAIGFLVYVYLRWRQEQEDEKIMDELRIVVNRAANKERYSAFLPDER